MTGTPDAPGRLEQASNRLNQKEDFHIGRFMIQDAGCGWGQHDMARPYSQDVRDRVVGSVARGRTCRATAALFGVSVASVVKWSQRWRTSGSAAAKPMGAWCSLTKPPLSRGQALG
jgi:hypothetical protein